MIGINGKDWYDLKGEDVKAFLASPDAEETFFFEFKEDRVDPKKITEEVSALANTFGGYIFFGVTDAHAIEGCAAWNEQRITITIHHTITPTPSFDIKKFVINEKTVYVLKVDEGFEPPYITNKGKIYERLSSSSCVINDSARLSRMIKKHEQQLDRMEKKISIDPVSENVNNVYGYIDIGFALTVKDTKMAFDAFNSADLKSIMKRDDIKSTDSKNILRVGHSYYFTPGGLSSPNKLPAHLNNFMEIMSDGSAKMRILLHSNDPDRMTVYMTLPLMILSTFKNVYTAIMERLFPDQFVYAKKYESLTVFKQFQPVFLFDSSTIAGSSDFIEQNKELTERFRKHRTLFGTDTVVTSTRIPKTGLYTIDKRSMAANGISDYSSESIINLLFDSQFVWLGLPDKTEDTDSSEFQ